MSASSTERRACLAAALASLSLIVAPLQTARAAPPVDDAKRAGEGETNEDVAADAAADAAPEAEQPEPTEPEPTEPEPTELDEPEVEVEPHQPPTGGGVAGAIVDPDDPNATRAQSDLEGENLDGEIAGVPERLPKLQAAGWWTTFAAVAFATTGGIFAGVAETREDEAERLAYSFDLMTGRTTLYGPVAAEYEQILDDGNTYQWVARGLIIAGGVTLLAGLTLFAVDGVRSRRSLQRDRSARVRLDPVGLRLRF